MFKLISFSKLKHIILFSLLTPFCCSYASEQEENTNYSFKQLPFKKEINEQIANSFGKISLEDRIFLLNSEEVTPENLVKLLEFTTNTLYKAYKSAFQYLRSLDINYIQQFEKEKQLLAKYTLFVSEIKSYVENDKYENFQLFTNKYIAYFVEEFSSVVNLMHQLLPDCRNDYVYAYYRFFIEPYDKIQRLLTTKIMNQYFSIPIQDYNNRTLLFTGNTHQGWGIFRTLDDRLYGVVKNNLQEYFISQLSLCDSPNLLKSEPILNVHRGAETNFYFYNDILIENDMQKVELMIDHQMMASFIQGSNSIPPFLTQSNLLFLENNELNTPESIKIFKNKCDNIGFKLPGEIKEYNILSNEWLNKGVLIRNEKGDIVINRFPGDSDSADRIAIIQKLCSDPSYNLRLSSSSIIIPLPSQKDDSILSLLYLQKIIQEYKTNPSSTLLHFVQDFDQYQNTNALEGLQVPEQILKPQEFIEYIQDMYKELKEEIISDYLVEIDQKNYQSTQTSSPNNDEDKTYQLNIETQKIINNKDYIKSLEKQEKSKIYRQKQHWKALAQNKIKTSEEDEKILEQASNLLEHKKTLFKYTTQRSINEEAKRDNARIEYKSAPHGYVVLKYKDGRADKKIFLSNHKDKSTFSVIKMGSHVLGHKFRNIQQTQNQIPLSK